jgi:choline monooxygenase
MRSAGPTLQRVRTLPAVDYWSPAVHRCERRAIFATEWQCLGPASVVGSPGAYLAEEVAGWPIVVVRGTDGRLRAFHNVCRHRAGPLVDDGCGALRSFVCRYHGWAYGLDGTLRSARDSGLTEVELEGLDLLPILAEEWRGLLFVCLTPAAPPLVEWLGAFGDACAGHPMEAWDPAHRAEHQLACNWKTYGDNYLEGYHVPLVHPALTRTVDPSTYRVEAADGWARHTVRTRAGATTSGTWLWHWPNLAINLYEAGMSVERWVPTGPTTCRLVLDYWFADTGPAAREANQAAIDGSTTLCLEDQAICEAVQRNLEAGEYDTGLLSPRHEDSVAAFHDMVRAARGRLDQPGSVTGDE